MVPLDRPRFRTFLAIGFLFFYFYFKFLNGVRLSNEKISFSCLIYRSENINPCRPRKPLVGSWILALSAIKLWTPLKKFEIKIKNSKTYSEVFPSLYLSIDTTLISPDVPFKKWSLTDWSCDTPQNPVPSPLVSPTPKAPLHKEQLNEVPHPSPIPLPTPWHERQND